MPSERTDGARILAPSAPTILRSARFALSASALSGLPSDSLAEVVFAGRSNSGKSSAINALTGRRQLARVSKTPGRTQLINFFALAERASTYLVDLPGYGYARVPDATRKNWQHLLTGYLQTRPQICGLVVIMDIRHPLTVLDAQLLDWFAPRRKPMLVLLSKADKLSKSGALEQIRSARKALNERYDRLSIELFSSVTGQGVDRAEAIVCDWLANFGQGAGRIKMPPAQGD